MRGLKRIVSFLCLGFLSAWAASLFGGPQEDDPSLRVMTFNIRYEVSSDTGDRSWSARRRDLAKLIRRLDPDLFGLQEVKPGQRNYLEGQLTDWCLYGDHRGADRLSDESTPIAYRRSRFRFVKGGTFWLSETPDKPGTKSWESSMARICTWAVLHDRREKRDFCYANTHLDHASKEAREKGLELIFSRLAEVAPDLPLIFTGDFNSKENSHVATIARRQLQDAFRGVTALPEGPWSTNVGFANHPEMERDATNLLASVSVEDLCEHSDLYGKRIDYVYAPKNMEVTDYKVVNELRGDTGFHYSDHFPVIATILPRPVGMIEIADALEKGTNFTSVSATVSAVVEEFCQSDEAQVTLTLYDEDGPCGTREHRLTKTGDTGGLWQENFVNLERGRYYILSARLTAGEWSITRERAFRAANEDEIMKTPSRSFYSARYENLLTEEIDVPTSDILISGVPTPCETMEELPDEPVKGGVAFLGDGDEVECVIVTERGWERTGQFLLRDTACSVLLSFRQGGGVTYRVRGVGEGWRVAGSCVSADSESDALHRLEVAGCGEFSGVSVCASDQRLFARVDGSIAYDDFAAVLAAEETDPVKPLWFASAEIPAERRLVVFTLLDPEGWLSLSGGTLLKETVGSDGSVLRAYGTMDRAVVQASDYLKATMRLGLDHPITDESVITLGELTAASGAFAFRVRIDGERIDRESVVDYVKISEDLAGVIWRRPGNDEIIYENGSVAVVPSVIANRAFARLELPRD